MTIEDICDAWRANDAVNMALLDLCADEDFDLKPVKGKTIRSNFVHLIGVRRLWLEEKMRKEAGAVPKLDWKMATRQELRDGLAVSGELMQDLFRKMEESGRQGRWKTTARYFAYCIAHEAHHRSQVEIALRINGREPPDAELYRLWEWPKK